MASPGITQRGDGRWMGSLQLHGKRKHVYGKTAQEVKAKLKTLYQQVAMTGVLPSPGSRTVNDLLDAWLENCRASLKPRTLAWYEDIARRYIRGSIGPIRLSKLEPVHIQRLYTQLQDSRTRVASHTHLVLHRALKLAVLWGWLSQNPSDRLLKPRYRPERKEVWSHQELTAFLEGSEGHPLHPLWITAIATGCRLGELTGLKWEDIDLEARSLTVRRNLQRIRGQWMEGPPKTRAGERTITLPPEAVIALKRQKAKQAELRLRAGPDWQDTGRVFTGRLGQPLNPAMAEHGLREQCEKLGLPHLTPHGMRHLHASLLLEAGLPITAVSQRLGHAHSGITLAVYSHVVKRDDEEAARLISAALKR
ncbi:MAG: site-specific integrase [Chloroflexi bacterium]|nr:site-specific integrase [Chloroflexota bacterium]